MLKFTVTANVHYISPVMQVTERFQKRELILDDSWEKDGKRYPNYVLIEFSGEKMAQLDQFYPGQRVNVEGMLTGREYEGRIFNTLKGLSVSPHQPQAQYPAPAPMPGSHPQQYQQPQACQQAPVPPSPYPQAAPSYPQPMPAPSCPPQQAAYPPQQAAPSYAPQPQAAYPQQPYGQASAPTAADLPFKA